VNTKNSFLLRFQVSVLLNNAALSKALENKCKQQSAFVGVALRKGLEKKQAWRRGGGRDTETSPEGGDAELFGGFVSPAF